MLLSTVTLSNVQGSEQQCFAYTPGGSGTSCFELMVSLEEGTEIKLTDFDESVLFSNGIADCKVTIDDVDCQTCTVGLTDEPEFCFSVDCSNIGEEIKLGTCAGDPAIADVPGSLVGIFMDGNSTFTLGSCDIESSGTPAPSMMKASSSPPAQSPTGMGTAPTAAPSSGGVGIMNGQWLMIVPFLLATPFI